MNRFVIYQAYGAKGILQECVYAICALLRVEKMQSPLPYQIIIYTDNVPFFTHYFAEMPLIYHELSPEILESWRGKDGFVHRVKIEMLRNCTKRHPEGYFLYVDTDTVFRTSPLFLFEKIETGHLLMHENEGIIESGKNLIFKKLAAFLLKNPNFGEKSRPLSGNMAMWNAGLLGFEVKKGVKLLEEVLRLTDALYALYPKHIMEQLAFSYYFQQENGLVSAEKEVFHYWNFKEFRIVLTTFFDSYNTLEEIVGKTEEIDPEVWIQSKYIYLRQPFWKRIYRKILGQTYTPPPYHPDKYSPS